MDASLMLFHPGGTKPGGCSFCGWSYEEGKPAAEQRRKLLQGQKGLICSSCSREIFELMHADDLGYKSANLATLELTDR